MQLVLVAHSIKIAKCDAHRGIRDLWLAAWKWPNTVLTVA